MITVWAPTKPAGVMSVFLGEQLNRILRSGGERRGGFFVGTQSSDLGIPGAARAGEGLHRSQPGSDGIYRQQV